MLNWLLRWVISGVALAIVAQIPGLGITYHNDIGALAMATVVIGLLNSLVKPILSLLTLPLNCLTFGLFGFILNAILFSSVHFIVPKFGVTTIWGALLGPILMGLLSGVMNMLIEDKKEKD